MRLSQRGVALLAVFGVVLGLLNLYLYASWIPRLEVALKRIAVILDNIQ